MRERLWLAGLTVVGVVLSARGAVIPVNAVAGADQAAAAGQVSGRWTAKTHPEWKGNDVVPRLQLSLRTGDERDHWGFGVPITELTDLPGAAREGTVTEARFTLTREAGVFRFTGSVDRGQGAGTFVLLPSSAYVTGMAQLGYRNLRDKQKREVGFLVVRDRQPWFLVEAKLADTHLSPALAYFQGQTKAPHAFQVVIDLPYEPADCFKVHRPLAVPARTLLSQLL